MNTGRSLSAITTTTESEDLEEKWDPNITHEKLQTTVTDVNDAFDLVVDYEGTKPLILTDQRDLERFLQVHHFD